MPCHVSTQQIDELEELTLQRHLLLRHGELIFACSEEICMQAMNAIAWLRSRVSDNANFVDDIKALLVALTAVTFLESALAG